MTVTETQLPAAHVDDPLAHQFAPPERGRGRHARPEVLAPSKPSAPLPSWAFTTAWVLVVAAVLALWAVIYGVALSAVQEHRTQRVLYSQLREGLAAATTPIDATAAAGTPIALVQAPQLGLDQTVVVQGTTSSELTKGPGHRADTVMPGQAGVSVLMGRSATYGAPFGSLDKAPVGSVIKVTTGQGVYSYTIDRVRRPGDPVPPPPTATQSRLVLMSASANRSTGLASTSKTVLVDATLKGTVAPSTGSPAATIPKAAKPMQGQATAVVPLLLWLQGLLLVVLVCVWAQARWGRRETWIAGFPLVLALLWGATASAMLLLPNLV